jgi:thymidylate synthase
VKNLKIGIMQNKYVNEDGTPFSKEEFLQKLKTDKEFNEEFGSKGIDQISELIKQLKDTPDSRRMVVSAWNPSDLPNQVLPPCHYGFQVYTRELSEQERMDSYNKSNWNKDIFPSDVSGWNRLFDTYNIPTRSISLMWNQRSIDTFLGLPFNIASYGLLLEIIAKAVNMVPDELIGNLGDVHLYSNHIEQAKEQIGRELSREERLDIFWKNDVQYGPVDDSVLDSYNIPSRTREPYPLPTLNINTEFWPYEGGECGIGPLDAIKVFESFKNESFCKCLLEEDIQLSNYQSHPSIKAPLSN